jgi:hypothetical protein
MNFCPECGAKVKSGAQFCHACGTALHTQGTLANNSSSPSQSSTNETAPSSVSPAGENGYPAAERSSWSTESENRAEVGGAGFEQRPPTEEQAAGFVSADGQQEGPYGGENGANQFNTDPDDTHTPRGLKILFSALGAVLLIGAGVLVYLFVFNQTPKQMFVRAELSHFMENTDNWEEFFGPYMELTEKMLVEPSTQTVEVNGDFDIDGVPAFAMNDIEMIQQLVRDISLEVTSQLDPEQKQELSGLGLQVAGATIADFELFESDTHTAVRAPFLKDEYFYFGNEQFGDLMSKVDPYYEGPEQRVSTTELYDLYEWPEDGLDQIGESTIRYLYDNLEDDFFEHDKENNTLVLSMNEDQVRELLKGYINELREDEEGLDEFVDIVVKWSSALMVEEDLMIEADLTDAEWVKSEIIDALDEAYEGLDEVGFPDGFRMAIMLDDQDHIIGRDLKFTIAGEDEDDSATIIYQSETTPTDEGKEGDWKFEITSLDGDDVVGVTNHFAHTEEEDGNRYVNRFRMYYEDWGVEVFDVGLELETLKTEDEGYEVFETDFRLDLDEVLEDEDFQEFSGKWIQRIDQNLDEDYAQRESEITFNVGFYDYEIGNVLVQVHLNVDQEIHFNGEQSFPDLESEDNVNVAEMSDTELSELLMELEDAFEQFMMEHEHLFTEFMYF